MQPCKVIVHAIKGSGLRKHSGVTTDSYLMMQLRDEPDSLKRTKAINNDLNPIWNQKFEMHSRDWNHDVLVVNMYNQNNNGEKMMNELELPIRQWPIGTHIDYQEDISNDKKKNAGRLFLGIDILNEDPKPTQQRAVKVAPAPKPTPKPAPQPQPRYETETYSEMPLSETETETQPLSTQSRGIHLDEPSCEYCDFSWGNDNSQYSTDFTGFTTNSSTLSALHSTEERFHHHHKIQRKAVPEPLQPIVTEEESVAESTHEESVQEPLHNHEESSCQHCDFNWGDLDSRYSTDFTGFTTNSETLSSLHEGEQKYHHNHKPKPVVTNSILAPENPSTGNLEQPSQTEKVPEQPPVQNHEHTHGENCSCQNCNFTWGNLDSRYSTDFTGFTQNDVSLSSLHDGEENLHHNHVPKQDVN